LVGATGAETRPRSGALVVEVRRVTHPDGGTVATLYRELAAVGAVAHQPVVVAERVHRVALLAGCSLTGVRAHRHGQWLARHHHRHRPAPVGALHPKMTVAPDVVAV